MANIRDLRMQIKSVKNIQKITRAMEMVSAAKLRKVQGQMLAIRPYANKIKDMMTSLAAEVGDLDYPLFQSRETKTLGLVVVSADKGLCGSYNTNLFKLMYRTLAETDTDIKVVAIGKKAVEYCRKNEIPTHYAYENIGTELTYAEVRGWTELLVGDFLNGVVDTWHILYTEFINAVTFQPKRLQFLPIESTSIEAEAADKKAAQEAEEERTGESAGYEFEPDPVQILDQLIPKYVEVFYRSVLLEAQSSEHAARMNAMKNATDNAKEMIQTLTLEYNKARQAAITTELLDIVGGAEALANG
jgi:F-type H+-transporting ATPase subunit gamma